MSSERNMKMFGGAVNGVNNEKTMTPAQFRDLVQQNVCDKLPTLITEPPKPTAKDCIGIVQANVSNGISTLGQELTQGANNVGKSISGDITRFGETATKLLPSGTDVSKEFLKIRDEASAKLTQTGQEATKLLPSETDISNELSKIGTEATRGLADFTQGASKGLTDIETEAKNKAQKFSEGIQTFGNILTKSIKRGVNEKYRRKYMKYKIKYLSLKNSINNQ